ncbi:MAG TPA: hypothetical protein VFH24_08360 [Gemmatimonadales bacterium]|nr:hypothetical protein [Gemmatimonadales bacterium]
MSKGRWATSFSGRVIPWAAITALALSAGCSEGSGPSPRDRDSLPPALSLSQISAGNYSSCGLSPAGAAYCWGAGRAGELGAEPPENCGGDPGEFPCATAPIELGETLTHIDVGGQHACGLRDSGSIVCWGDGTHGQLGGPPPVSNCSPVSTGCARLPQLVPLEGQAVTLSAGGSHTCVLDPAGIATCWGYNQGGRLGTGDVTTRFEPTPVTTDLRFIAIAAGGTHTCAIAEDGRAYCWGYNHLGQLGDGSVDSRRLPTPVATELRFRDVVTGVAHSCARTEEGAAYCWGAAGEGQLGTNAPLDTCEGGYYACSLIPGPVVGGHAFTALSADRFTCGVGLGGSFCWGPSPTNTSSVPVAMRSEGLTGRVFIRIDVGSEHACGVTEDSLAYCWGSDYQGTLGDGPAEGGPEPALVREPVDSVRSL